MDWLFCLLIKIINFLLEITFGWFIQALVFVLAFLPTSPIQFEPIQWGEFGNAVGYFIPVGTMATHFALILVTLTIWYAVQHILRILKMVR